MEDLDSESFLNGEDWKDWITVVFWMLLLQVIQKWICRTLLLPSNCLFWKLSYQQDCRQITQCAVLNKLGRRRGLSQLQVFLWHPFLLSFKTVECKDVGWIDPGSHLLPTVLTAFGFYSGSSPAYYSLAVYEHKRYIFMICPGKIDEVLCAESASTHLESK